MGFLVSWTQREYTQWGKDSGDRGGMWERHGVGTKLWSVYNYWLFILNQVNSKCLYYNEKSKNKYTKIK